MGNSRYLFILFLGCLILESVNTYAAAPPNLRQELPGSVQPGLIGTQVPGPSTTGKTAPALPSLIAAPEQKLPPEAERIKFKLNKIIITGATAYKPAQLEHLYQKYIGQNISLVDLQNITDSITKFYRGDGYILTKAIIPAQKISNGVVTLQVIEGYIANVTVAGDPRGARKQLVAYGKHLTDSRPANISTLERYILLANDISGLNVKTVLSPAKSTAAMPVSPGATDATLIADEHMASGYASYDNRGTRFLGPLEWSFGGNVNSIFRSGDQTSVQGLVTTNASQLQFYRATHQTPLGSSGLQLNLAASYSNSMPTYTLQPFNITGRSVAYSTGLSYPVIRTRVKSLYITTTFDLSDSISNVLGDTLYNDKIRSLRLGTTFSSADSWSGINQIGGQISKGLPIFGYSRPNQTNSDGISTLSRAQGQAKYTKANFDASRLQWLGATNFSVLVASQGQFAFTNPLLVAEQFTFGGAQFGQAYDPSQFTGDHGLTGKFELRYDQDISAHILRPILNHIQYFTYYDIGKVWNVLGPTPGVPSSGASTGFGIRTQFNRYVSGYAEYTQPLTSLAGAAQLKIPRIFFGITVAGDTPSSLSATVNPTVAAPPPQAYQPVSAAVPAVQQAASQG